MGKIFGFSSKPKSTNKKAKTIIRSEIRSVYGPSVRGGRSTVDNMKKEADSAGDWRYPQSDYQKGAQLVQVGNFAINYDEQRVMLGKIYGKKNVETWSGDKVHNTYKHLIGREYAEMIKEKNSKKLAKKTKSTKAGAKSRKKK